MSTPAQFTIYADGSCIGNPGAGGWGALLIAPGGVISELTGANPSTTNNRMEITAALEALRETPVGAEVSLHSDSQYLVKTMTLGWKRRENLDLWRLLDAEVAKRRVHWHWVRGHSGDPYNERADELARSAAEGRAPRPNGSPAAAIPSKTKRNVLSQREVVELWVERFNAGDADGLADLYHPDAVNHQVTQPPVEGVDAIRAMFEAEFARADMSCIVEAIHEAGDVIALEWRDPLGLRGCGFFTVRDGRIAFQRGYWDKLSFLKLHGLPLE